MTKDPTDTVDLAPPARCDVVEAWTRTDTQRYTPETIPARVSQAETPKPVLPLVMKLFAPIAFAAIVGVPREILGATFAMSCVWLLYALIGGGHRTGGSDDTSEPFSWLDARVAMRDAMRVPGFAGERDVTGERVKIRGRVRARTVLDAPDGGWCVAWEQHTPVEGARDERSIERAGGVFDVVTDDGFTVRVDARHVAVCDWRAQPQRPRFHHDVWTVTVPDGALVDVAGELRVASSASGDYRGGLSLTMEGSELTPVYVARVDASAPTRVRVDADRASGSDEASVAVARDDDSVKRAAKGG